MSLPQLLDPVSRLEFLQARQSKVGSSDIGPICDLSPFSDAIDVYLEKTRPVEVESEASIHLLRGVLLEPIGAELYTMFTDRKVRRMGQRSRKDHPWAGVHADRQILASNGDGTGALEIKAPGTWMFNHVLESGLPDNYIAQLQWQLYVTGYSWGEYAVVNLEHQKGPLQTIRMERNEDMIGEMVKRAEKFWKHVEDRTPLNPLEWIGQDPLPIPEHDKDRHYLEPNDSFTLVRMLELDREKKRIKKEWEAQRELAKVWLDENEMTRTHIRGYGKINYTYRDGKRYPNEKRIYASKPLDRDLVRQAFADHEIAISEDTLSRLEMDLSTVMNQGDAYRHFQCWPAKIEE